MADFGLCTVVYDVGKSFVGECLWPSVNRHVDYWRCFRDNIQGLRDEIGNLERERRNMDQKIEEDRLRAASPTVEVENWSRDGAQKIDNAASILQGCDDLKAWNIMSRYSKGKSAKKTAEEIAKLRSEVNSIRISNPPPPPAAVPFPHEPIMEFESRRSIEEEIMKCLIADHACLLAICGAGGVGKTTMVRRIEDRVSKEKLFDEVVHLVVSQQIDMLKIQKEMAELLRLHLSEDTLAGRANKLRIRLADSKRKLIIFDDVWKRFNLTDLGVPLGNDFVRCKIILTSRVKDVCEKMNAQKIIPMKVLTQAEAWTLLKEKAGSYVEDSELRPIAEDVAEQCNGLPVALVTVGEALKHKSIPAWRDALNQLKRAMPTDFPEVLEGVYKPLKLSYDFLESESVKSFFLLCCLFPEDYNIPIEHLTFYSIGLGVFEGISNIEEGRNRTHSFVEKLISRFLLIDIHRLPWIIDDFVRMHDVVRDVAIFTGSKEKHGFLKNLEASSMNLLGKDSSRNCNWMSVDISIPNVKPPVGSEYPNLRLLMIRNSGESSQSTNVDIFAGMEELNVLSFSNINLLSFPRTLELLKKLTTLHLDNCKVKDISIVGKLASLEILFVDNCNEIEELPADIGRLSLLRVLKLNNCGRLKRIVAGIISSLVGLEELKIIECFDKWEAKGNQSEESNVALSELESLTSLSCLEIQISDCNLVCQEICLSQRLKKYRIDIPFKPSYSLKKHERNISLTLDIDATIGNWIRQLVRSTQKLMLSGDGSNIFNLAETESLRELVIQQCYRVKKLVNAIDCKFHVLQNLELEDLIEIESIVDGKIPVGSNSFQKLESLILENLPKLEYVWKSLTQNVSLGNLTHISVCRCPSLIYLFSVATLRGLVQLQKLDIRECDSIEQLFLDELESNDDASIFEFPKLKKLKLRRLSNLTTFSQGVEIIEFPQLIELEFTHCPKLRTKIGKSPNLKTIKISDFNGLHQLLSSCYTRERNIQLEKLDISNYDTIEEILWDEIEAEGDRHIEFPELRRLSLSDMPCLTTFYRGVESIKFPKLKDLLIGKLPRLNGLAPMDSEPTHDDHSLHLFCNPKVEFPALSALHLSNLQNTISNIWCHNVPINFFHNLVWLEISNVNGIGNLMSSSIAKNLVDLKYLYIEECQEMVEMIGDDNEVFFTSLFPNLEVLCLISLHKLRSFCQWKHAFELPSLREVRINDCPAMETFTLGSLSTPNLSTISI